MKSLQGFNTAQPNEIPLCEVDGRLHCMQYDFANVSTFTNSVS